jgi:DNA-binding transcriptional LysR family regulator
MLNLWRLHLLRELSVLGTITAVAESHGLTRPAVSAQLSLLETESKSRLFERDGRGIALTQAGERLAARAKELLELADEIQGEMVAAGTEVAGEVRISAFGSFAAGLMPSVFRDAAAQFPELELSIEEIESGGGLKAIISRKVDIAIIDEWADIEPYASSMEFQLLGVDHFVAVVSSQHSVALKRRKRVGLSELARDRWTINNGAPAYRAALLRACYSAGFTPKEISSCRNMLATLALIRDAGFVSVLPAIGLREVGRIPGVYTAPLEPLVTRNILLATPRGTSNRPNVKAVIDMLRKAISAGSAQSPAKTRLL